MTCNRNCDCVGECKAGNENPTTPTPGDLSARLLAAVNACEANKMPGTAKLLREAAATLSALPAGGGEDREWTDRWSDILPVLKQNGGADNLRGSGGVIGNPETDPSDPRLAPHHCKGTNCTASKANDYKHSSECLFEHARAVASGIKSVAFGVEVPDHVTYIEWRGKRIDLTTPQPSAAEGAVPFSAKWLADNGQRATMEWCAGWDACRVEYPRTAPPAKTVRIAGEDFLPMPACLRRDVDDYGTPDAAVGAQGDNECAKCGAPTDPECGHVGNCTTPAAGKGVDALPANWRATSDAIAKPYGFVTEHTLGKAQALDACADELEAALTRQPVAGDGMVLAPREPTDAMVNAARGFSVPGYCIAAEQWPSVWGAMLAAAPAATPTDGGEG